MSNIVKEFDCNKVTVTTPVLKKNGKLASYLLYDGETFLLRLPTYCKAPFGLKQYSNNGEKKSTDAHSLNISAVPYDGSDSNRELVNNWFDNIEQLDKKMINEFALEGDNSKKIFNKKYTKGKHEAVVEALYIPIVKHSEDKDGNPYPRRINIKVKPDYDNPERPNAKIFKNSKDNINVNGFTFEHLTDLIQPGTFIDIIAQPNIWFIGGKFGITWKLIQAKTKTNEKKGVPKSYAFSDDESEEDDSEEESGDDENENENEDEEVVSNS